jgi:hypothetical protein
MGNDFKLEFHIEKQNQWKLLKKGLYWLILSFIGFLYYFITNHELGIYFGIGFIIPLLLQLVIHLQYYIYNKGKTLTVNL